MQTPFTLYRTTTIGQALLSTLQEMEEDINENMRDHVLQTFDKVMCDRLNEMRGNSPWKLVGSCKSYNNCDDVWSFHLDKCHIKGDGLEEMSDDCKIIAIDMAVKNGPIVSATKKAAKKKVFSKVKQQEQQ